MSADARVPISDEASIVTARQTARLLAREIGFGTVDQSRITTAVSELTRNIVRYATGGRGEMLLRALPAAHGGAGIEATVRDEGPGIADIDAALRQGYTSGNGMGLGLPGAQRLMDEMTIDSALGRGTTVTIRKWRR